MQDEILTDLAKIADLKVISRTSVMQYKSGAPRNLREIGQQLGVAHVVEGSVQRAANKVRVNAQLIDARTDAHLWAQTYDRDLADVFAIQSEIAKAIADQLQAKLSPNEKKAIEQPPTTDLAAFDLYSRAKSLLLTAGFSATSEPDLRKAIELLDEAVKRDPSFFDAYCQLAYAHEYLYAVSGSDHTPARLALAEAAVQAATRLRPDAAETHLARAQYLYYGLRDYAGALAELEIARRALPNDPRLFELTGYILRRRGQQEEGLQNLQRAVELDPRNFFTLQQIALSYQYLGRYAEAIAALDRALAIVPDNVETRATRGEYYIFWKADTRPLHQTIDAILAQGPGAIASAADSWFVCALAERDPAAAERALVALGDNPCWGEGTIILSRSFGEGLLARMTKDEARARTAFEAARAQQEKIVQAQPDYGPALCVLGLIDAALGRKDLALDEGRRAIALTPLEKDVINGSRVLQYFAITAAWAGEKELALQQLEAGLRAPARIAHAELRRLKTVPGLGPAPRRSALRKNRRLARAEIDHEAEFRVATSSSSLLDVKFEIGHVLFIDIVGYSKLLINEQRDQIQKLKAIVRGTEQFRLAEAEGKLLRLPTGDGGALVFRTSPEAPVLCAMEISKALKSHPELHIRMGIHSGPVNEISDLNEQANLAGAGINIAHRVMDCGDAGHILLSRHVAEDLEEYPRWWAVSP